MAIVAEDNYTRTNQQGWGTSTNGAGVTNYAWAGDAGGASTSDITITSNVGQLTGDATSRYSQLDDGTTRQSAEVVVEATLSATANTFGALACYHGTSGAGTEDTGAATDATGTPVGGAATGGGPAPGSPMPLAFGGIAMALVGGGLILSRWRTGAASAARRRRSLGHASGAPRPPAGPPGDSPGGPAA